MNQDSFHDAKHAHLASDPIEEESTLEFECPVCSVSLSSLHNQQRNAHINQCLDFAEKTSKSEDSKIEAKKSWDRIFHTTRPSKSSECSVEAIEDTLAHTAPSSAPSIVQVNVAEGKQASTIRKADARRSCPFYKKLPGTTFVVDAFNYGIIPGITGYFLSHFHSDHYIGLRKSFDAGTLFCSSVTANLVESQIGVDSGKIRRLPMNSRTSVSDNVSVILLDANHCPGSVMFLFELSSLTFSHGQSARYLHTGDFRSSPSMEQQILLKKPLDLLYLDTTYLKPLYRFPPQDAVVKSALEIIKVTLQPPMPLFRIDITSTESNSPFTRDKHAIVKPVLILVGTYLIGKERFVLGTEMVSPSLMCVGRRFLQFILEGLAEALGCKIYASKQKMKIFACLEDPKLTSLLTTDSSATSLHIVKMNELSIEHLSNYLSRHELHFSRLIAFRPTGWSFTSFSKTNLLTPSAASKNHAVQLFSLPYSEHSSFSELESFVKSLRVRKIVPTVNNATDRSRQQMATHLNQWRKFD